MGAVLHKEVIILTRDTNGVPSDTPWREFPQENSCVYSLHVASSCLWVVYTRLVVPL